MAIIYADQVTELAIEATYAGRPVVNVLHFVNDESAVNDATKAKDFLDNWQDHIVGGFDQALTLTGARWRSLDRDDLNQGTLTLDQAKPLGGSVAGTGAPPNVALLVKKQTENRQRGQRDGRMFLAGVPGANLFDDGSLSGAFRTSMQTRMNDFLNGVNDTDISQAAWSGLVVLNTTPASRLPGSGEVDLTYRRVSALTVDAKVASQRDRLR